MKKGTQTFEEKYEIVGVEPGIHDVAGFGKIDLNNLDVVEADHLFNAKFPFLQKKSKVAPEAPKA